MLVDRGQLHRAEAAFVLATFVVLALVVQAFNLRCVELLDALSAIRMLLLILHSHLVWQRRSQPLILLRLVLIIALGTCEVELLLG